MAAEDDTCTPSRFELWVLQIFILLGLLVFFIWLGIRPKSPNYTVTDFTVQKGGIPFAIEIQNPNKNSQIYYANITITCHNHDKILGSTSIPSFSQDQEETTPKNGLIVFDYKVWKELEVEITKRSTQLEVTLVTKIRYRTWGIKSPREKVRQRGELPVGPDGKMPGKNKLKKGSKRLKIRYAHHLHV